MWRGNEKIIQRVKVDNTLANLIEDCEMWSASENESEKL